MRTSIASLALVYLTLSGGCALQDQSQEPSKLEIAFNQINLTEDQIDLIRPILLSTLDEIRTMAARENLRQTLLDQRRIANKSRKKMDLALQEINQHLNPDQIEPFNGFSRLTLDLVTKRKTDMYSESALSRTSPMLFYRHDQSTEEESNP